MKINENVKMLRSKMFYFLGRFTQCRSDCSSPQFSCEHDIPLGVMFSIIMVHVLNESAGKTHH